MLHISNYLIYISGKPQQSKLGISCFKNAKLNNPNSHHSSSSRPLFPDYKMRKPENFQGPGLAPLGCRKPH